MTRSAVAMDTLRRPLVIKRLSKIPCWRRNLTLPSASNYLIKFDFSVRPAAAKRFFSLSFPENREKSTRLSSLLGCRSTTGRAFRILADADGVKAGAQRIVEQQC